MGQLVITQSRRQELDKRYWNVIGGTEIGGKAQALRDATPAAIEARFFMPKRIVAGMERFTSHPGWEYAKELLAQRKKLDDMLTGIGNPNANTFGVFDAQRLLAGTKFSDDEERMLVEIFKRIPAGTPWIARSSAHGDACGNGNYASRFIFNYGTEQERFAEFKLAVMGVVMSQYSLDAIAYRKDLNLPEGVAVMLEPVFGAWWKSGWEHLSHRRYFGPDYGGISVYGNKNFEGFTVICKGLPTSAVRNIGVRIDYDDLFDISRNTLGEYYANSYANTPQVEGRSELLRGEFLEMNERKLDSDDRLEREVRGTERISRMNLEWLAGAHDQLNDELGMFTYIEYGALAKRNEEPQIALIQVAPLKHSEEPKWVCQGGRAIAMGKAVESGGTKACDGIIIVKTAEALERLREYNGANNGYVLIFWQPALLRLAGKLGYADTNGANAIFYDASENSASEGHRSLEGHLGGGPKERGCITGGGRNIEKQLEGLLGPSDIVEDTEEVRIYRTRVIVDARLREQSWTMELADQVKS
ncbi:MAG: hypothetical protein WCT31_01480 [Candidatus Micrarchaeia archaeon]